MNREEWLSALTDKLRPMFREVGAELPEKVRLSCGWPSCKATSIKHRSIGEAWPKSRSKDGVNQVFISPVLSDKLRVAGVLVHELVHVWNDCKDSHKGPFKVVATKLGLTGKMTSTGESDDLKARLNVLLAELPDYPNSELDFTKVKTQSTRLLKVVCSGCSCIIRMTRKAIDEVGLPTCACGDDFEEVE